MRLAGKVVLLTGASSGIGWAAAKALAAEGAKLALLARREDKLKELAALLTPAECLILAGDVADTAAAPAHVAAVEKRYGRLDILINNAGVTSFRLFKDQDLAEMENILRINYLGTAALIRAALPGMLARKDGYVLNVASIAGLFGMPQMAAYSASKFALVGLTEALRREYRDTGVTLTAFCPGSVDTPMTSDVLERVKNSALTRPKTPEQVAERIVRACLSRPPEVVYGEAPAGLIHFARFIPRFSDWVIARALKNMPSLAN